MTRKPVTLSETARAEREAIADCLAKQSYPADAHKTLARIRDEIRKIATFPKAAPLGEHLLPGTPQLMTESDLIFYREYENEIAVLPILHGARDRERFFKS